MIRSARHVHAPLDVAAADAGADAAGETRRRCADVLYGVGDPESAAALLRRYPGCLLASVRDAGGRCVTVSRSGVRCVVAPVRSDQEHELLALMLHRWLTEVSSRPAPAAGPPDAGRRPD